MKLTFTEDTFECHLDPDMDHKNKGTLFPDCYLFGLKNFQALGMLNIHLASKDAHVPLYLADDFTDSNLFVIEHIFAPILELKTVVDIDTFYHHVPTECKTEDTRTVWEKAITAAIARQKRREQRLSHAA